MKGFSVLFYRSLLECMPGMFNKNVSARPLLIDYFLIAGSLNQLGSRANHVMFKKALSDEFETLLCLKICAKFEDGALKLVEHHSGLFTVAVCVMSNYSKSRVLSLQLLTRLCDMNGGHKQVSDAISMLRLRFGEPVRLKFLVGMLNSYNSTG